MPAYVYVLKCEGCGQHRPFSVHEGELLVLDTKKPVERHCPTCRTMTNWVFAFLKRRSRRERRIGSDRRRAE